MRCGKGKWKDRKRLIRHKFAHTSRKLTVKISTNLNEGGDNESFGFSNLRLTMWCTGVCQRKYKNINDTCKSTGCRMTGWLTNIRGKKINKCGHNWMLGGYGVAGKNAWFEKSFYFLPHSRITFSM